jgi:hypothetical protein
MLCLHHDPSPPAPHRVYSLSRILAEKSTWDRQTDGKNLVWFGEIERKLAKLSMTTFAYRSSHKVRTYKEYHSVCPSSELGLPPTPHPQASVPPPPCFWGEGNTRWRERGGRVPIPTRGIHCGNLYM